MNDSSLDKQGLEDGIGEGNTSVDVLQCLSEMIHRPVFGNSFLKIFDS